MQVHKICMICLGLSLSPSFSLAQDESSDLPKESFTVKEIQGQIFAFDALASKLDEVLPTENGEYLIDVNDHSTIGGAMISSFFYRHLVLTGEGNNYEYIMRTRIGAGLTDLGTLAAEFEAGEVEVKLQRTPEGLLDKSQSYLQFHTSRGVLIIGDGSSNSFTMDGNFNSLGVAIQHFPPARKIPYDIFFTTDFRNPIEASQVLGGKDEFGKYAPQMHKLKVGLMQEGLLKEYLEAFRRRDALSDRDVSRIIGEIDEAIPFQPSPDFKEKLIRSIRDSGKGGIGGVLIGLGVVVGGLLLSSDTVLASQISEDSIPIHWILTQEEMEAYRDSIRSQRAFWSESPRRTRFNNDQYFWTLTLFISL